MVRPVCPFGRAPHVKYVDADDILRLHLSRYRRGETLRGDVLAPVAVPPMLPGFFRFAISHLRPALLCFALASAARSESDRPVPADVSAMLAEYFASAAIPGGVALVLHGDQVVAQGAAGVRQRDGAAAVTPADPFHLGSCTKAMTATLVAMRVDEGRLRWEEPLPELFGDAAERMNPAWREVTLRDLLTHRSGLPANIGPMRRARLAASRDPVMVQRRRLVGDVLREPPEEGPPRTFRYSNLGYILLGAALEHRSGRGWEQLLRERLFTPLGITSAGFGAPRGRDPREAPWGHRGSERTPVRPDGTGADNLAALGPAGTVHMNLADWGRFVTLHLRGDPANPRHRATLLTADAFAALHRPRAGENYAGGWIVGTRRWARGHRETDTGVTLTHTGSNTLWFAVVWLAPEIDFAVLVACNAAGGDVAKTCDAAVGELIRGFAPAARGGR